jgi:hypothetical protein
LLLHVFWQLTMVLFVSSNIWNTPHIFRNS